MLFFKINQLIIKKIEFCLLQEDFIMLLYKNSLLIVLTIWNRRSFPFHLLNVDLESFSCQFGHSSRFVPFLEIALAQISGVQIGKSAGWMYSFVEAGRVWDAKRRFVVVTRIAAAAPYMPFIQRRSFRFALPRRVRLATHAAWRRRSLRWRRRTLGAS